MPRVADLGFDLAAALDPVVLARKVGFDPYDWQARILRSRSKRQILNCSRQAGKSRVVALKVTHGALYDPGSLTLILSPSERQSGLLLKRAKSFYDALGQPVAADIDNTFNLELANGSEIWALPGKEGTVRGFSDVKRLIVDEASRIPSALYYAIRPMLAASSGELILLSTPFGKLNAFYDEWVSDEPWERTEVPAEQVPHFAPEFLEEEKRRNPLYEQEYNCKFLDAVGQVFGHDLIARAVTDDVEPLFGDHGRPSWVTDAVKPLTSF